MSRQGMFPLRVEILSGKEQSVEKVADAVTTAGRIVRLGVQVHLRASAAL